MSWTLLQTGSVSNVVIGTAYLHQKINMAIHHIHTVQMSLVTQSNPPLCLKPALLSVIGYGLPQRPPETAGGFFRKFS